jgi:hypothetical protein
MGGTFLDAASDGNLYARKNAAWSIVPGAVTIIDTPPASPTPGQLWWDSTAALLYVYYQDPTSSQWVDANNGAGIQEAPTDGKNYSRRGSTQSWQVALAEAPTDGRIYARQGSSALWQAAQAAGALGLGSIVARIVADDHDPERRDESSR